MLKILSYPRSVISGIFVLLWTFFWSLITIIGALFFRGRLWWGDFVTRTWATGMLIPFSIKVEVEGEENLSSENGIFVFNHSSHFDIPILLVALRKKTIRFGAKAELFKIPFFGSAMTSVGALKIHRGQRDRVIKLYKKSLKNLTKGYNYILAPEGTRQSSEGLGDFKTGPFLMAISGQCPIFPVVIDGAHKIMPKHSTFPCWGIWSSRVKVKILAPVATKGLEIEQRTDLRDKVREEMASALGRSSGPIDG